MEIEELFSRLRPLMGEQLERLRLAYLAEDADGQREIETVLRLMYAKYTREEINKPQILLPPPDAATAAGEFVIGDVVYNDRKLHPFGLRRQEMLQHVAVFGRSGSGKSNTVFQMIDQLLRADIPFLIFDWKRNYRDLLGLTDKEILVFTVGRSVAPIKFNPLIPPPGVEPQAHLQMLVQTIAKAFFGGDGVISLLQQAVDDVYTEAGVYDGTVTRFPVMRNVLEWLEKCPAKGRAAGWLQSAMRAVRSLCFGQMGQVINCDEQLPLAEMLNRNIVLELDALEGACKSFYIDATLLFLHHYRMGQPDREVLQHCIILEEAHHVLRAHEGADTVTDVILREIRELGESIVLIDQHPSSLSIEAVGNTFATITLGLKARADLIVAANYTLLDRDQAHIFGELQVGQAVVKLQDRHVRPFLVSIPHIPVRKGSVTDSMIRERMQGYLGDTNPEPSREPEPQVFQPVPAAEEQKTDNTIRDTAMPNSTELAFLTDCLRQPELGIVQRIRSLNISRRKVNAVKSALVDRGLLRPVDILTGTGRVVLLELTAEGKAVLERAGADTAGYLAHGGAEHQFWVERVAVALRERGYTVEHEYRIAGNGAVDILATRDGEQLVVEVETGQSDVPANIRKCLAAGFGKVLIAATHMAAHDKIARWIAAEGLAEEERLELALCQHRF